MAYTPQFSPQPFGIVSVASPGTPVQLTSTLQGASVGSGTMCVATDIVACNKISFITNPLAHSGAGNTGKVYIGQKTMSRTTLAGVVVVLSPGQSFPITTNVNLNEYDFSQWYLDADNAGDGVYGSIDTV